MKGVRKDIVPLLISFLLVISSLLMTLLKDYVLGQTHYIGIGCLVLATIFYFTNRKVYYYFFTLTLVAGLIGLVDFFYRTIKVGIGAFGINPIFLLLLILFFIFGKDSMNALFPEKNNRENNGQGYNSTDD